MATLLSLPLEVRMAIWKQVVPREMVVEVVDSLPNDLKNLTTTPGLEAKAFAKNPRLALLLISSQSNSELSCIKHPILILEATLPPGTKLNDWINRCTKGRRSLVSRIALMRQAPRNLADVRNPSDAMVARQEAWEEKTLKDVRHWFQQAEIINRDGSNPRIVGQWHEDTISN